jgi:hypothetical protein
MEKYAKNKKLPMILEKLAILLRFLLRCVFESPVSKKVDQNTTAITSKVIDETKESSKDATFEQAAVPKPVQKTSSKCNFCNRCDKCECDYLKEKQKKDKEKELELNLAALNILAFCIVFLIIFTCNATIWFKIGLN